jgi:large repetitive protein
MLGRTVSALLVLAVSCLALAGSAYALDIADANPSSGTVGVPYSYTFSLSPGSGSAGASWSISSGVLPPGLALSSNDRTGTVYGTPTQAGSFRFYIKVVDAPGPWVCCTEEEFVINIDEALSITAATDLPVGNLGQAYGYQLGTAGGTATTWAVSAGSLPPGIQLSPAGAIVGTPTQAVASQFTVQASDGSRTASKQFTLKVTQPMIVAAPAATAIKLGRQFLLSFSVKGGLGPFTWAGVDLPEGIGVNPTTGQLGGRPKLAGPLPLTVKVTDATGASATATATVTAATAPVLATAALPVAHVGKRFKVSLRASGGAAPLRLRVVGAPAWLRLDTSTGALTGTPKLAPTKTKPSKSGKHASKKAKTVTYRLHVTAYDAIGQRVTTKLTLTVKS